MAIELPVALITIFLATASILWFLFPRKSLPGPCGVPILGYLPFLQPDLHLQLHKLAQKYGPIFKLNLGTKLCVVVSSPGLIKQIVRENDAVFANRDPPASALIATGGIDIAWAPNGVYWREIRKLFVREVLSNKNLDSSYPLRREEVRKAVRKVRNEAGKSVDIGDLIFNTDAEVIMNLLWGPTLGAEKSQESQKEFRKHMTKFVDLLGQPNISDFFPILSKFDFQGIARQMREVFSKVEKTLDFVIEEKKKQKSNITSDHDTRDVLHRLLELIGQDLGDGVRFGVAQIKLLLLDILAAGTDTTSTGVEWVMTEILYHPHVMDKVVEEVTGVVGRAGVVEEWHLRELRYLEAVVKEALRLHPPLPLIMTRSPSRSCAIGGYEVPAGARVLLNVRSVQMDPNLWDSPSEFRPERFLEGSASKADYMGSCFQYLPFGSGRRVCPGMPLAERMVMHFVATLVHSFEWRLPDGETVDRSEKFGILMRKKLPLVAVPYPRLYSREAYS